MGIEYQTVMRGVFEEFADGTPVSMFIVRPKGSELDGDNPTILTGYGGFNVSRTPTFGAIILFLSATLSKCD